MPRHSNPQTDRATITKLRAKVAQLEASLAEIKLNPPEPDMTGWTLDERIRTYTPDPETLDRIEGELVERLTIWGRNKGVLSEAKLKELERSEWNDIWDIKFIVTEVNRHAKNKMDIKFIDDDEE